MAGDIITYGAFVSSASNDCTPAEGGPTSLTIDAVQAEPAPDMPYHMTFCLPRPDELGDGPVDLADERLVQVIDVWAQLPDGCRLHLERSAPPQGTIDFLGYCDDGLHPDGYAVALDATVPGERICDDSTGTTREPVTITLRGTVAVAAAAR